MNNTDYKLLQKSCVKFYGAISIEFAKSEMFRVGILTTNSKLSKSIEGYESWGIAMPHADLLEEIGIILCTIYKNCKHTCIGVTGPQETLKSKKGGELSSSMKLKLCRLKVFLEDREFFDEKIRIEIVGLQLGAKLKGLELCIRPNISADIDFSYLAKMFPEVQFYDYTKVYSRKSNENYFITYSWDGDERTWHLMEKALRSGNTVTIVTLKGHFDGMLFRGFETQTGDDTDGRFLDQMGKITVLKRKVARGSKESTYNILVEA